MVQRSRCKILGIAILFAFLFSTEVMAQRVTYNHDESKKLHLKSMEKGPWDFGQYRYYLTFHKKFSGADYHFNLLKGERVSYHEDKSNVKRVFPVRLAQLEPADKINKKVQAQIDATTPVAEEEALRTTERSVDLSYKIYKESFLELNNIIEENIKYIKDNHYKMFYLAVDELQLEYDVIRTEIDYMHKQGPTVQVENTKRTLVYEDALNRLYKLAKSSNEIAILASTL